MSKKTIDGVDSQILAILSQDARASAASIARVVNLSRGAIQQRIDRMERSGIITGYTAVLSRTPVDGEHIVTALVMVNLQTPRYAEVASELAGWPEIRACWSTAGEKDMALLVSTDSNDDLMEVTRRLNELAAVRDTATHVALRTHFDRTESQ
ncbi:Lrp/AsnC family transcriptional regulator [Rhodococcus fascians]|nr:Lrp/AsnC family transcriptional regulator [Rhodococcus fascians]MBY4140711.1 Lrp/AsnC family transcriptional regulator [Rhodococcus fascians]MBY4219491.1 Lrp/AsnC family transcriptional regulator [Rhodococcus fascians]MBY4223434.1 Lrp/AsnC family transcriptional regulator [Rhodococcus fascians]MBY4234700.1 Lrp/AsnC family transcriptional regulator [Rhodococcus fascians]